MVKQLKKKANFSNKNASHTKQDAVKKAIKTLKTTKGGSKAGTSFKRKVGSFWKFKTSTDGKNVVSINDQPKKKICLGCRREGHLLADCPFINRKKGSKEGGVVCYNCGDPSHSLKDCPMPRTGELKFCKCFVCGETGHLSSKCPKNPKGIYPNGGGCRV